MEVLHRGCHRQKYALKKKKTDGELNYVVMEKGLTLGGAPILNT